MPIEGSIGPKSGSHQTGARNLSVVTVNAADGDVVSMDGDIVTAWADSDVDGVAASVTATNGEDATVQVKTIADGSAGGPADVTVHALVE